MVERREDLVEVDGISFEDSLPLGGRDSCRRTLGDLDEEFRFGYIAVVDSQKPTGFLATGVANSRGGVGRVDIPGHIGLGELLTLDSLPVVGVAIRNTVLSTVPITLCGYFIRRRWL
jgi:hypothetical protein